MLLEDVERNNSHDTTMVNTTFHAPSTIETTKTNPATFVGRRLRNMTLNQTPFLLAVESPNNTFDPAEQILADASFGQNNNTLPILSESPPVPLTLPSPESQLFKDLDMKDLGKNIIELMTNRDILFQQTTMRDGDYYIIDLATSSQKSNLPMISSSLDLL